MNKYVYIFTLFIIALILSSTVANVNKSSGPPSCNAGEPPNNTTCKSCHEEYEINSGTAITTFNLGEAENGYEPGKTYTISININKSGMQRAGFQAIALQANDNKISPGIVTLTDANRTQILDKNAPHSGGCLEEERVWIEHTYNGINSTAGTSNWQYQWKAPNTDIGAITFYISTLEANNDLNETGDYVYSTSKTINSLPVSVSSQNKNKEVKIYVSNLEQTLNIETNNFEPNMIVLTDINGKIVNSWAKKDIVSSNKTITLSTKNIAWGIYFISLSNKNQIIKQKIIIQ